MQAQGLNYGKHEGCEWQTRSMGHKVKRGGAHDLQSVEKRKVEGSNLLLVDRVRRRTGRDRGILCPRKAIGTSLGEENSSRRKLLDSTEKQTKGCEKWSGVVSDASSK